MSSLALSPAGYLFSGTTTGIYRSNLIPQISAGNQDLADEEETVPSVFQLQQNYPNPFNPLTVTGYSLLVPTRVTAKVYDLLAREVRTLVDHEEMDEGYQEVEFDGSYLPSGVYYYRLVAHDLEGNQPVYSAARRMLLVK